MNTYVDYFIGESYPDLVYAINRQAEERREDIVSVSSFSRYDGTRLAAVVVFKRSENE